MKTLHKLSLLALFTFLMVFNTIAVIDTQMPQNLASDPTSPHQTDSSPSPLFTPYQSYVSAQQGWTQWSGVSSGLPVQEFGNRSDTFSGNQMRYFPSNGSTSSTSVSVPMDPDWEGHKLSAELTDLTENRTWVQDP
ncbi:MAG: hypothetical protein ACFFCP_14670, partial [Promethearchaeota archaeon]